MSDEIQTAFELFINCGNVHAVPVAVSTCVALQAIPIIH